MDVNNIINDNNNGSSGDSVRGKFRDRLRLIRINRFKKYKNIKNDDFVVDRVKEIDRLVNNDDRVNIKKRFVIGKSSVKRKFISLTWFNLFKIKVINKVMNEERDRFVRGVIRRIKETAGDRNYIRYVRVSGKKKKNENVVNEEIKNKEVKKNELKIKIVRKIKRDLEKKNAELEVLEHELFLIKEKNDKEVDLDRVKDIKREIGVIRDKIDNIIGNYNIYRDSYDVIGIDNSDIVDDIIAYKDLVGKDSIKVDYELLDEYRDLYNRLVNINLVVDRVVDDNKDKVSLLSDRDYKFYNMKNQVTLMNDKLKECDYQISKQKLYLKMLMKKIDDIERSEYSTYRLKGLDDLVANTINYVSLLMISPLAGLIPSIYINTLATRKMIKNIYSNLKFEKVDHVRYESVNYDFEIRNKLNDLDYTYDMVDDTIKLIDKLKMDMVREFGNINGVSDTLGKLDVIRDKVVSNRDKMDVVKKKLVASKKINDDKLIMVKKLNNG